VRSMASHRPASSLVSPRAEPEPEPEPVEEPQEEEEEEDYYGPEDDEPTIYWEKAVDSPADEPVSKRCGVRCVLLGGSCD
jgi:hypothetical protein